MNSFEKVFARICLEHGWAGRSQIAEAVRARSENPGGTASLAALLIAHGVLTEEQAATLQSEASDVTRTGAYAGVRDEDTWLGQLLVESGAVAVEHVEQALAVQAASAAQQAPVPRLGEILIEKGVLSYANLQDALQRQSRLVHLACTSCGKRYTADRSEPGQVYVCEQCASPLSSSTRLPAAESSEPEEVLRAAGHPSNVFGKYVLVSPLGKGAMGAVYKAWDRGLRRWVAIKVLLATSDPALVLRFRREAETAAAIQHPNIVPIYDIGESAGRPFLVMKFVEGSTLSGMSLSLEQACDITLQAAKGVAYAHERDIVHRDLKPGNVMVDGSGHVYVMDFGLAKDLYSGAGLTKPGTVMGTPSYMPPEQAAGKTGEVDRSSDVYALGAILYELVTGRPPFRDPRLMETIRQVLEDPVPAPSRLRPGIPGGIEGVILKALEKEKRNRYPTATVFARALESIRHGSVEAGTAGPPAPPVILDSPPEPARPTSKVIFWAVVLIVLSLLSGVGVLHLLRGGSGGLK
ncbi:MAG TPA: serine/threonine-protein kinase [Planctomycetota bacterium]|nr:serine/threonine-protein kinase [Planctomycetota bacterium]